jgi:hypothetical protein
LLKLYRERRDGKQSDLFHVLNAQFPDAEVVYSRYKIEIACLDQLVDTQQLLSWLRSDQLLPANARKLCIETLTQVDCPSKLKVAMQPLSCDFVLECDGKPYFWESHEEQHKTLSDGRMRLLFDANGNPYGVHRGLQRLVRDVWRVLYLRPYTIVWRYRGDHSPMTYVPELVDGFHEFAYPGEFSFKRFCGL